MPALPQLTPFFHQASITGKVIDAALNGNVGGVRVAITAMPVAFEQWLAIRALQHGAAWSALATRPDLTVTAGDGCFHFLDLPAGIYTLSCSIPGGSRRYGAAQKTVTVTPDANGLVPLDIQSIELPPTAVRGTIMGDPGTPKLLPMARVRVRGSGEVAYCDPFGLFYLTGVEIGQRTLEISASGHQSITTTAAVVQGQITELGSFVLVPTP